MRQQHGIVLLETLIGLFIFLVGILGLAGLFALSMQNASEAQYRAEAAFLAHSMIAEMRVANASTRATDYVNGGTAYANWKTRIMAAGSGLPGASAPTVSFSSNVVTLTLNWKAPNDSSSHQYLVSTALE